MAPIYGVFNVMGVAVRPLSERGGNGNDPKLDKP